MRCLRWLPFAFALLALSAGGVEADNRPAPAALRMIVNPRNPSTALERRWIADAFLKKATRWPNDELVRPVDLDRDSPVRRRFSEDVLKRSVSAVASYWQQLVFSGRGVPPPEFDSEEQVVKFVLKNPGAIGYVSGNVDIGNAIVVQVR
jgi:ABC-type phosphate transport system substrate-binding protein